MYVRGLIVSQYFNNNCFFSLPMSTLLRCLSRAVFSLVLKKLTKAGLRHSRSQRPRSVWSGPRIETSGPSQNRKSAINGLIFKSNLIGLKLQNEYSAHTEKLGQARGHDSWCWPKGSRPLGTRMVLRMITELLHMSTSLHIDLFGQFCVGSCPLFFFLCS